MLHPIFHTPRTVRTVEIHDDHETLGREIRRAQVLHQYMEVPPWKGYFMIGQHRMQVGF